MSAWDDQPNAAAIQMVETQIRQRGVEDERVLEAMRSVPRHRFVASPWIDQAHEDRPLPIGKGQTISQPYIVALMSELLYLSGREKVLEIGTGSGYQTAILARLCNRVLSMEIHQALADQARARLEELGHANAIVRSGDGHGGWPEEAPFDAICITAAPPEIPLALLGQLRIGGRMIVPVGVEEQQLLHITKTGQDSHKARRVIPVRFVQMIRKSE